MTYTQLNAPPGTVQFGSEQSELIAGLAQRALQVLRLRGYRQVMVPMYEPIDLYASLYGSEVRSRLVTFTTDCEYALRPDLTAGICRTLAPALSSPPPSPIRMAAWGRAYRHERVRPLRQREFHQLGIERVGDTGPAGDLEIISLARAVLLDAGLYGGLVRIGHSGLRQRLMDGLPSQIQHCLDALSRMRDRLNPPRTGVDRGKDRERILPDVHPDLPSLLYELSRGTGIVLDAAGDPIEQLETHLYSEFARIGVDTQRAGAWLDTTWSAASLDELADKLAPLWPGAHRQIHDSLGHIEACTADLNPVTLRYSLGSGRWAGFYTGFTFEFDAPILGPDVCQLMGGGRYDGVMAALGAPESGSCGFGLGLERLGQALIELHGADQVNQRFAGIAPVLIAWAEPSSMESSATQADLLNSIGCPVAHHTQAIPTEHDGPSQKHLSAIQQLPGMPYRYVLVSTQGITWLADLAQQTCLEADESTLRLMFDRRGQ